MWAHFCEIDDPRKCCFGGAGAGAVGGAGDGVSTLEMACRFRGRGSILCIGVAVCAGAAFCICLKGLDVVERAAGEI